MPLEQAQKIRLLILDVDGVLTDGSLIFGDDGQQYKQFNVKDGLGIKLLQSTGVSVAIISSREAQVVQNRADELGIKHVYQGQANKQMAYSELKQQLSLSDEEIAYVGDDLPDLPLLMQAGLAIAVDDASERIQQYAHWVTDNKGGHGAVREVCEFIMSAQRTLDTVIAKYESL